MRVSSLEQVVKSLISDSYFRDNGLEEKNHPYV